MLSFIKSSRFVFFHHTLLSTRQNFRFTARPLMNCCKITIWNALLKLNIRSSDPFKMIASREKSTTRKKTYKKDDYVDDDDDDEDDDDQSYDEGDLNFKGDEVKIYETQTARVDKILKVCLKISRKNIEDLFYQTKVRVNGKMLKKKSINADVGDEIDIINGFVNNNPKLINVNRIEILNIKQNSDNLNLNVKVKKSKSLVVENYNGSDEWRG